MKTWFFGELLMRLECTDGDRIEQVQSFGVRYTGAEANSAVAMCALGGTGAEILTAVPDDALGTAALSYVRRCGPGVSACVRAPGRLGTYYLEQGAGLRPSQCIYDRRGSVFCETPAAAYGVESLFSPGDWLQLSGTAPAVSPQARETVLDVLRAAQARGVTVSLDLNYRARLWDVASAKRGFAELMPFVDVLIANQSVAESFLGVPAVDLCRRFDLKAAALTRRGTDADGRMSFGAALLRPDGARTDAGDVSLVPVDRVGSGDAFAGAIILALERADWDDLRRVRFAHACGTLKHFTRGDFSYSTAAEVEAYLRGEWGDVRR